MFVIVKHLVQTLLHVRCAKPFPGVGVQSCNDATAGNGYEEQDHAPNFMFLK